jgi:hypothetical protein
MLNRWIIGLVASASALPMSRSHAQRISDLTQRLRPGATLRVQTQSSALWQGRLLRTTPDTLFLLDQGSEVAVGLHDLHALWQRGTAAKTGAFVGGGIAATGVLVVFYEFCVADSDPDNCGYGLRDRGLQVVATTAGAALVGGLIGGVIGSAIPKWHRRYP